MSASLCNKNIVLGVGGGIAAYKSADLVRRLSEVGANVHVVMTDAAQEFITPLTMQAVSGNPVHTSLLDPEAEAGMGHIELARWADLILIAPTTADLMAQMAAGHASHLLTTLVLATNAPVAIAPAMNQAMWANASTKNNLTALQQRGVHIFGPGDGIQACGDTGAGRMLEAIELRELAANLFNTRALDGKRVLITAGPTQEPIDPVRYISNHSSGKMGFALATAAAEAGAITTLIAGPVSLPTPDNVRRIDVISAQEMLATAKENTVSGQCDIFIACAAVADYRVDAIASQKIKKKSETLSLELVRNPDILATISADSPHIFSVGFAAETEAVVDYARDKLVRKGLNMIIANDVSRSDIGFGSNENQVTVVTASEATELPQMNKQQLARALIERIGNAQSLKEPNQD